MGANGAHLRARVVPGGSATSVYFQYSEADSAGCAEHACVSVPVPPGESIGSVGEAEAEQRIEGLTADTTYHFRVVAVEEGKEFPGPDHVFTTQIATGVELPDGRRWEMVSPAEKQGSRLASQSEGGLSQGDVVQAAADGDAMTYIAYAPTEPGVSGYFGDVQVFSARNAEGWHTWDMTVPVESVTGGGAGFGNTFRLFNEDLSLGFVQPFGAFIKATPQEEAEPLSPNDRALAPGEATEQTAFVHTDYLNGDPAQRCERPLASCYRPLFTSGNVAPGSHFGEEGVCPPELICGPQVVGITPDGAYAALEGQTQLGENDNLYLWHAGGLELVAPEGQLGINNATHPKNAISSDGARVVYHVGPETGNLFMRDMTRKVSIQLDLPEPGCGSCGSGDGQFEGASTDGSRIYFADWQKLTADSGANPSTRLADLYECRIVEEGGGPPACDLTDLTPKNAEGESAAVPGPVVGMSEDGSWVYFVADGRLEDEGAPIPGTVKGTCEEHQQPPNALCNLYAYHDGETRLIAVLSGEDAPDWGSTTVSGGLEGLVARASPDGQWLAFMSERELTGYDNRDAVSGKPDEEAYLYNAISKRLVCASCNPTGSLPRGEPFDIEGTAIPSMPLVTALAGSWHHETWLSASLPEWSTYRNARAAYHSRSLSNNGRLFFDSDDALVSQDQNENWDVYEFEQAGVGSCTTGSATFHEAEDGCVDAISSGASAGESAFMDASATGGRETEGNEGGGDVFFITAEPLAAGQDDDHALDVYDAHECTTASPCVVPPASKAGSCASADACRTPASPPSGVFGPAPTASVTGPGNQPPPPAKPSAPAHKTTQKERLAKALKACRAKKNRAKRKKCESAARKRYPVAAKRSAKQGAKR